MASGRGDGGNMWVERRFRLYLAILFTAGVIAPSAALATVGTRIPEGHFLEWGSAVAVTFAALATLANVRILKGARRLPWLLLGLGFLLFSYMELDTNESSAGHLENYAATLAFALAGVIVALPVLRDMGNMGYARHMLLSGLAALVLATLADGRFLGYDMYKNYTVFEETCELLAGCLFYCSQVEAHFHLDAAGKQDGRPAGKSERPAKEGEGSTVKGEGSARKGGDGKGTGGRVRKK